MSFMNTVKAKIWGAGEKMRDPIAELEYAIAEKKKDVNKYKRALIDLESSILSQSSSKADFTDDKEALYERMEYALSKNDEAMAERYMQEILEIEAEEADIKADIDNMVATKEQLAKALEEVELGINRMMRKADAAKGKLAAAKAQNAAVSSFSGVEVDGIDAGAILKELNDITKKFNNDTKAIQNLTDDGILKPAVGKSTVDKVDAKIALEKYKANKNGSAATE